MQDTSWIKSVERWRNLPIQERYRLHLEAIPRHVANSMAMEGEPVDEALIREQLEYYIQLRTASKPTQVTSAMNNSGRE